MRRPWKCEFEKYPVLEFDMVLREYSHYLEEKDLRTITNEFIVFTGQRDKIYAVKDLDVIAVLIIV